MKTFTLDQARIAVLSGGVLSVNLRPLGSVFTLEFETRTGPVVLVAAVSKQVRRFGNPVKVFEIVRSLGLQGGHFSLAEWQPQNRQQDRPIRPDKTAALKLMHEAAGLKKLLDERVALANSADTIWHDVDDVFADIEADNAR